MPDLAERYPVQRLLDVLYGRYSDFIDGKLADYIPELAAVDPKQFAISLATVDGFCYDAGQVSARFTIQTVSKAVVYGLALEDWGHAEVLADPRRPRPPRPQPPLAADPPAHPGRPGLGGTAAARQRRDSGTIPVGVPL